MKTLFPLTFLLLPIFLFSCQPQNTYETNPQEALITALINHPDLQSLKSSEKLIILKTKYCQYLDCEIYFQNFKNNIQIYSDIEAFMRGLGNFLQIEMIDEENKKIIVSKRERGEVQKIEITLDYTNTLNE